MKHYYFWGASDDCHEVSGAAEHEAYGDILVSIGGVTELRAHYEFDGDWGVELVGELPSSCILTPIKGNCATAMRRKPNAGMVLHLQVPDEASVSFRDASEES
jgi:hypothetical protein